MDTKNKTSKNDFNATSHKTDVSGSITTYKHTHNRQTHISSKSNFFGDEVYIKYNNGRIEFGRVGITYEGKRYKFHNTNGIYHSAIVAELPIGKFDFDEDESNEDMVVVYCH